MLGSSKSVRGRCATITDYFAGFNRKKKEGAVLLAIPIASTSNEKLYRAYIKPQKSVEEPVRDAKSFCSLIGTAS